MALAPLVVFYAVLIIRALPWPKEMMTKKPLSCDACLSFWVTVCLIPSTMWFFAAPMPWAALHLAGAPALSVFLLSLHAKLQEFRPP